MLNVPIKKLHIDAILPQYQSEQSSGFDIHSIENKIIKPHMSILIKSGLAFAIPKGYELQIRPRSGLALKHGITVLNSPGTVDSDYRGEVGVILINHSNVDFEVNKGDRIAQGVIGSVFLASLIERQDLDDTTRGSNGFGSTGAN